MRLMLALVASLLLSVGAAQAKVVVSGKPLIVYWTAATNPDCTSAGNVEIRVTEGPEHGRLTIRRAGVFPNFPESNPRSACNRRRVPGVEVIYTSQRGYVGSDNIVLEAFFPQGRGVRVRTPIQVM
jgi:hypothetical protein